MSPSWPPAPVVAAASAVTELLLGTSLGRDVEETLADPANDVHVPALCDVEVTSVLRRLRLSGDLSARRCGEAVADYRHLPVTRHGHITLLDRVLDLGANISPCDAVYVALAERLGARLLATDDRLRSAVTTHTSVRLTR